MAVEGHQSASRKEDLTATRQLGTGARDRDASRDCGRRAELRADREHFVRRTAGQRRDRSRVATRIRAMDADDSGARRGRTRRRIGRDRIRCRVGAGGHEHGQVGTVLRRGRLRVIGGCDNVDSRWRHSSYVRRAGTDGHDRCGAEALQFGREQRGGRDRTSRSLVGAIKKKQRDAGLLRNLRAAGNIDGSGRRCHHDRGRRRE